MEFLIGLFLGVSIGILLTVGYFILSFVAEAKNL